MPPIPKTKKIELLAKLLQKRLKGLPVPSERTVLEHLIYAALLENASFEQADAAYAVLEGYFIDWNEIRVSTVRELADTFSMLPDPAAAGNRVRSSLQGVFEKTYMFDLEELRKKGKPLGQAIEFLREIPACTRFMVDYTAQVAFGGHCIPLDEASLRVFRLLGLAQVVKDGSAEGVPGLERAIAKKNGINFSSQLHHFAAGFFMEPLSIDLRNILKPIDSEAVNRDWAPPMLVITKTPPKPATQRPLPVVTLPFAAPDEDDFEEEAAGTEAEFLPDPYRPEERETSNRNDNEAISSMSGEKKSKETKEKKKPEPSGAKPVTTKPAPPPKQMEPKTSKSAKEVDKPKPPPKQAVKQPPIPQEKKRPVVSIPVEKPEPKKGPEMAKAPPPKKPSAKEPPKKQKPKPVPPVAKKPPTKKSPPSPSPKPIGKPTKSSTRQLREKKPK